MIKSGMKRRAFLQMGSGLVSGTAITTALRGISHSREEETVSDRSPQTSNAVVSITRCPDYSPEVQTAMEKNFDLLGGIGKLVKGKTVTIKVNLTGAPFRWAFDKSPGETYITHSSTVIALAKILFKEGAKRVRVVDSAAFREPMREVLISAGWYVDTLLKLGNVELENTRNLGEGKSYSTLKVPFGGYLFSSFELNHSYEDTDVLISLAKLKNHSAAGITLSMKNMFGITPNSRYSVNAGDENTTSGRMPLHGFGFWRRRRQPDIELPGAKEGNFPNRQGYRIPRIIVDLCAARPVDIAIIDGITSISGGEGPWCRGVRETSPGILITGFNPVSTDAVGTAVMGYKNPLAESSVKPFEDGDNHILLAQQAGLGTGNLSKIEVRGLSIEDAKCPYEREQTKTG